MTAHYLKTELDELFRRDDAMWSFVQHGSLDGVWYWDLEQPTNEWMSPEFWRLFGVDPATRAHDPAEWQDLIFQDDLAVALENFQKHCADPEHPYDQIVRYRHADGSTVWVRCRGVAIRDEAGKPVRMLGAHNDYTPIKRAEAEARRAAEASAAANEELRDFAYSVSHDMKAPANTMDMLLSELIAADEGGLSDDQRSILSTAQQTVAHMRQLVEDMLVYTRTIGETVRYEPVMVEQVIDDARAALSASIRDSGAVLTIGALPSIEANPGQMRALFQNLIENAIKYRHPDRAPQISVTGQLAAAGQAVFEVADNGLGVEPAHQAEIFQMFRRLHRADEIPGAGLGLTLCRRIVSNHNGSIALSSHLGEGSRFSVALPIQQIRGGA